MIYPAFALREQTPGFDIPAWFGKHGAGVTRPYIDNVVAALKEQGVTQFGATGYCLGGESTNPSSLRTSERHC